ncbi:MAG: TetR/AcrR family transcriptional regulator [Gemmatimonadetes bacterium]|nr:TetR/AcrR family transcriptional regulator [Gemmatimonadota bacterium]
MARSAAALQLAMRDLLHERPFAEITVQHIIDRAGVSRGTFYARFRNKDDALYASVERMYAGLTRHLGQPPRDPRLAPVAELLTHVGDSDAVRRSLALSGRLEAISALLTDFVADGIEQRLPPRGAGALVPARVTARMLAGALMELLAWWVDHPGRLTAEAVDAEFHRMARSVVRADGTRG